MSALREGVARSDVQLSPRGLPAYWRGEVLGTSRVVVAMARMHEHACRRHFGLKTYAPHSHVCIASLHYTSQQQQCVTSMPKTGIAEALATKALATKVSHEWEQLNKCPRTHMDMVSMMGSMGGIGVQHGHDEAEWRHGDWRHGGRRVVGSFGTQRPCTFPQGLGNLSALCLSALRR